MDFEKTYLPLNEVKGMRRAKFHFFIGIGLLGFSLVLTFAYLLTRPFEMFSDLDLFTPDQLSRLEIRDVFEKKFPDLKPFQAQKEFEFFHDVDDDGPLKAKLTLKNSFQKFIKQTVERYHPDYASVVVMDPKTGKLLAVVDHIRSKKFRNDVGSLYNKATFPAASVFKVITAAAGIDTELVSPDDRMPFNGKGHTLYKSNLSNRIHKWTRWPSFKKAFARSYNPVFGKLGFKIGGSTLQEYANRFKFNENLQLELPVEISRANIPQKGYELAEKASGYTKKTTLSPLQGAMIASTVINKGVMMAPFIFQGVSDSDGVIRYLPEIREIGHPISKDSAEKIAGMMNQTIVNGTSRGSFRGFSRDRILSHLYIGGKTGSLTGNEPRGKYDWFVGFAQSKEDPSQSIAFSVMIINKNYWYVRSAQLARKFIRYFFREGRSTPFVAKAKIPSNRPISQNL